MNYRHLGKAGIQVSELSFGSWVTFHTQVDVKDTVEMMAAAYDAGVNFFDNAEAYANGRSEEIMGEALKRLGWRRGSYLVSTKLFWGLHDNPNETNTLNRKYLLEGIDGSLQRLDLDYVDLLFCHRADPATPVEETVWAMHNIIERGKALYWGTSEWEAADIQSAIDAAERYNLHKPVVEQPVYNPLKGTVSATPTGASTRTRATARPRGARSHRVRSPASTRRAYRKAAAARSRAFPGYATRSPTPTASQKLPHSSRSQRTWARRWRSFHWRGACRTPG